MQASDPSAPAARAVLLCVLLALAAWSGAIVRGGFAYDDAEVVRANPVVEGSAPVWAAFERDYWDHVSPAGHYRPTATLSLRLDHALWGPGSATGWHLTNVLLHAGVVLLLGALLLRLGPDTGAGARLPWFGLALFAAHPVLADSVAWISGRTSMLSAGPGLAGALALACLLAPTRGAALAAAFAAGVGLLAALLGKEDGVVFVVVYALIALRASPRTRVATGAGCVLGLAAYLALRAHALGSPWPVAPHAPLASEPLGARLLIAGRGLLELLRLVALPAGYPPSYDRDPLLVPAAETVPGWLPLALLGWLPWLALAGLGAFALLRPRSRVLGASALLAALSLVPMLQLVPAGAVLAPRFLYLPLLFSAPLVHRLWRRLGSRARRPVAVAVLAACVAGCWMRAGVYADRASYHRAVLAHRPDDAPAWNELGLAREESADPAGARAAFEHSARLDPGYSRPWSNLGRLALARGDLPEAQRCLARAVELGPSNALAHVNLGAMLLRLERPAEALEPYGRALELAPRLTAAWRGLGRALAACGRREQAREALRRALELDPGDATARRVLETLGTR